MPEPALLHGREIDQYGYAPFNGNFYWVPGSGRGAVQIIEYSNRIQIVKNRENLAEYELPAHGIKGERIKPPGTPIFKPPPTSAQRSTQPEETSLRAIAPSVASYLDFLQKTPTSKLKKYKTIRHLHSLSLKLSPKLFTETINRSLQYSIACMDTVERIAVLLMRAGHFQMDADDVDVEISDEVQNRALYRE